LKSAKDLQAIAMVARGLFELAVDAKLIGAVENPPMKIVCVARGVPAHLLADRRAGIRESRYEARS
jgi:hypothetical protein